MMASVTRSYLQNLSASWVMIKSVVSTRRRTLLTSVPVILIYVVLMVTGVSLFGTKAFYAMLLLSIAPLAMYLFLKTSSSLTLAYVVLLPIIQHFSFYGIEVGEFLLTPHMVIQGIIMIVVFVGYLGTYDANKQRVLNGLDKVFLVFVLLTVFSMIFAYTLPVNHTKRWLLFYTGVVETVAFYFTVLLLLSRDEGFPKKLLTALVLTSFSAGVVALIELDRVGFNPARIFLARMTIGFGYHNTNLFGIHSVIMFPLVLYAVVHAESAKMKILALSSFLLLTVLSILCFNRGTVIVLALQLVLLYATRQNRRAIHFLLTGIVLVTLWYTKLILFYLVRFLAGSASTAMSPLLDASALYRLEAWKVGLRILVEYPFGVGGGGFQYAWRLYGPDPTFFLGTPHHLFLSIGVDYGVLALAAFLVILGLAYRYTSELLSVMEGNPYRDLFRYVRISLIGFIAYGMITDGELSHLTGFIAPNNGYTLILFAVLAFMSFFYSRLVANVPQKPVD